MELWRNVVGVRPQHPPVQTALLTASLLLPGGDGTCTVSASTAPLETRGDESGFAMALVLSW